MLSKFRVLLAVCLCLAAPAALAQTLFSQKTDYADLTLHAGIAGDNGTRIAALRMELKPGWKTYWRIPGDSGVPPTFDWSGSENLADVAATWPVPRVFDTYGDESYGYDTRMIVPLTITPVDPGQPLRLKLKFSYGVCADICIPAGESFELTIPAGAPADGAYFIRRAMADKLSPAPPGAADARRCAVEGAGETRRFAAEIAFADPFTAPPVVLAEGPKGVWFGKITTRLQNDTVIAEGPVEALKDAWVDRSDITLTVLGDGRGMVLKGCRG